MAAHLLIQVREKLCGGTPTESKELSSTDLMMWAQKDGVLKDTRDTKELAFLAHLVTLLNQKRIERLADVVAMRIRELRFAKASGQSWEKAEVLSLVGSSVPSSTLVPDPGLAL